MKKKKIIIIELSPVLSKLLFFHINETLLSQIQLLQCAVKNGIYILRFNAYEYIKENVVLERSKDLGWIKIYSGQVSTREYLVKQDFRVR